MAKKTLVLLTCPALNTDREFEITHAERLLRMPNNGGWRLPDDSQFEFDKENGLKYRRNKETNKRTQKRGND